MADSDIEIISNSPDTERFDVALPVSRADFADFLTRVIGGKDKLEFSFKGSVLLDAILLASVEDSIRERVSLQSAGKLVSTRYAVRFKDGRGIKADSLQKILSVSPRAGSSTQFISAQYIVVMSYPGMKSPARETISLSFGEIDSGHITSSFTHIEHTVTRANLEIEYFNRVWAEDSLNSLLILINQYVKEPSKGMKSFLVKFFGDALPIALFAITFMAYNTAFLFITEKYTYFFGNEIPPDSNIAVYVEAIHASTRPFLSTIQTTYYLLLGVSIALLMAVSSVNFRFASNVPHIKFAIYDADKAAVAAEAKQLKYKRLKAVGALFVSLIVGIASSYIYAWLTTKI